LYGAWRQIAPDQAVAADGADTRVDLAI